MSQYISSFLIDPVVRQARRFSRPTVDIPQVTGLRPSLASNEEPPRPDPFPTAAMRATQEDLPRMRISTQMFPSITLSDGPEVIVPATLERPRERELQAVSDGRTSLQLVEMGSLEPAVNARRYTLTYIEDVSRNPPTGIHNGGGSTTSSLNGSGLMDVNMTPAESPRQSLLINAQDARGRGDTGSSQADDGFLPADDGMGPMRRRIIAIQRTDSSYKEKARLVHGLMTEKHNSSQQSLHGPQFPRAHSPGSLHCSERPWTPSSPKSMDSSMPTVSPPTSSSSYGDAPNPFHLSPDDLKPTYYEKKAMVSSDADQEGTAIETEETSKALGCAHYKRNIKLQCSACSRWYTCRFCHDAVEDHMLNRRETKNMLCMLCGCAQPASQECAMCSKRGAWYYCDICKLWDDDLQKHIYHCNDCGICRLGQGLGKDFFHCKVIRLYPGSKSLLMLHLDLLRLYVDLYQGYSSLH